LAGTDLALRDVGTKPAGDSIYKPLTHLAQLINLRLEARRDLYALASETAANEENTYRVATGAVISAAKSTGTVAGAVVYAPGSNRLRAANADRKQYRAVRYLIFGSLAKVVVEAHVVARDAQRIGAAYICPCHSDSGIMVIVTVMVQGLMYKGSAVVIVEVFANASIGAP